MVFQNNFTDFGTSKKIVLINKGKKLEHFRQSNFVMVASNSGNNAMQFDYTTMGS
jgi:hypothetical protein